MLEFDNRALRGLPIDARDDNRTRQVFGACFSRVRPTPVPAPRTLAIAQEVAALLELEPDFLSDPGFAEVFSGNRLLPGMDPVAACYGGHQFGSWAGQLGDGRAISLGELKTAGGEHWELQLKGAGPTPYSRRADGRAVLRSSVREFLCSEAMHHLGIPTTRALCVVATGESVVRDILYDGNPRAEPGAIVCRVAPTFLRFGNFEVFASRDETDVLKRLADYTIRTYFPELGEPSADAYVRWYEEVSRRTAELLAKWLGVGFVHGVMNTDNMSILGLTIDYGPYGFLDDYDPQWTPNITDASGRRYRYENQPRIGMWNLACLAGALKPLVGELAPLEAALNRYQDVFEAEWRRILAAKLGLRALRDDESNERSEPRTPDSELVAELFELLTTAEIDFTLFFRNLADVAPNAPADAVAETEESVLAPVRDAYYAYADTRAEHRHAMAAWLNRYRARSREEGLPEVERRALMNRANPKYILRNYIAQLAIDRAEQGDPSLISETLDVLRAPFDDQPARSHFAEKRPDWARNRPGCSMLSCSS